MASAPLVTPPAAPPPRLPKTQLHYGSTNNPPITKKHIVSVLRFGKRSWATDKFLCPQCYLQPSGPVTTEFWWKGEAHLGVGDHSMREATRYIEHLQFDHHTGVSSPTVLFLDHQLRDLAYAQWQRAVRFPPIVARGPPGPPGVDGLDGIDGVDGVDGRAGVDGANGVDGVDGVDGRAGVDGRPGVDGVNGVDGVDGRPGVDGVDGVDGQRGERGERGERGQGLDTRMIESLLAQNVS
ncbi:uncharacterized protein LOC135333058 [Halichondria panicea]|uniref:uncharacterized protein LOC135333058 n=1 Tax=Halichondria panicea TaxID=6063 RepID=UPI00312B4686